MFHKLLAFWKRDCQIEMTYRLAFFIQLGRTITLFLSFFFIGKLFTQNGLPPQLAAYGGNYFQFVFLGITFSNLMTTAAGSLRQMVGSEMSNGTLEVILLTPTPFITLAMGKVWWDLGAIFVKTAGYLLIGAFLFRIDFSQAHWTALLLILSLSAATFLGFGMFSVGFNLITRESNPIEFVFGWLSRFLAGVYFPIAIFPGWLKTLSAYLPLTYTLEAARKSLIGGAMMPGIGREITVLAIFSLILLPTGFFFFSWAFDQARRRGNLSLN